MAVIVHLNHVFDNTVIEKRMEYAFNKDGSDFWERFFLCETRHPDEKVIYLFTQPQLRHMHDWLKKKISNLGTKIAMNLDLSRQSLFHDPLVTNPREPYGYYKLRSCYVSGDENELNIIETFRFSMSPPEKETTGWNEFFDDVFIKTLISTIDASISQKIIKDLETIKKIIRDKILRPETKKWLHYLGPETPETDHPSLQYCAVDTDCPLN